MSLDHTSPDNVFQADHAHLLLSSFEHFVGRPLLPNASPETLFHAPFPVLSHNTAADPILTYGNRAALELWEMSWDAFTAMPSRLTAEPDERETRAELLASIGANGFIDTYTGVRISQTGRRFLIEGAIIWNLIRADGTPAGQAATFDRFTYL